MSFITSGVKILEEPRRYVLASAGADSVTVPVAEAGFLFADAADFGSALVDFAAADRVAAALRAPTVFDCFFAIACLNQSTSFFSLGSRLS
jgi:hypothetical protein